MRYSLLEEITESDRGDGLALATVIASHGSAPREAGAQMIVYPDGKISGTVGGGEIEYKVIKKAQELIEKRAEGRYEFDMSNEDAARVGGICGGRVEIFIESFV
ncbi:MAG: XdhC family protein [Bacillota bacterium]